MIHLPPVASDCSLASHPAQVAYGANSRPRLLATAINAPAGRPLADQLLAEER